MPNVPIPRSPPRWTRGDVGREIGQWILAEVKEQLQQAGINGRTINAGNVVGVVPPAAVSVSLDDLRDVTAPTPTAGQVLTWDDTLVPEPQWVAADPTGTGGGVGLAGTMHQEFLPAAAATTVTLAHVPIVVLTVTRNGVTQSVVDGHYSIAGAVLTFTDAFDGTDRVIVAYVWDDSSSGGGMTEADADLRYVPLVGGTVMQGPLSPVVGTHPDLGDWSSGAIWGWVNAQVCSVTDYLDVESPNTVATGAALATSLLSEGFYRFVTQVDGRMRWGSGSATADTFLERTAAATLTLTGNLYINANAVAASPDADNYLEWRTNGFYVPTPRVVYNHRYFYASSTTMADPGNGNFRTNATWPTPATQIAIDVRDGDNIDIAPLLAALRTGDTIRAQLQTDSTIWRRVRLTANPTDMTGWYLLDVEDIGGAGTVPASGGCLLTFFLTGGAGGGLDTTTADARYVNLTGDTMTGNLTVPNIGMGSAPHSGWGGTWRVLGYNTGGFALAVSGSSMYWVSNTYHDGTSWHAVADMSTSQLVQPSNGAFVWYSNPSPGAGGTYTPTMRMNLNASGGLWVTGTLTIDGVATFNNHVGVSSTPPGWVGYRAVHVGTYGGGIASGISGNTATFLLRNLYYDNTAWRNIGAESGEILQLANRAFIFLLGTNSGVAGGSSTVTQHGQIDANGLGLGTVAATATIILNAARNQDTTTVAQVQNQNNTSSAAAIVQAVSPAGACSMWAFPAAYGAPYGNKGMLRATTPGGLIIQTTNASGQIEFHTAGGSPAAYFSTGGHLLPGLSNNFDLGDGTTPLRWRTVYAVNAFNTSHSAYKRDWHRMDSEAALRVVQATEVGTFRMRPNGDNDPVARMVRVGILADRSHSLLSPDGVHVSGQDTACLALAAIQALCSRIENLEAQLKERA